MPCPIWRLQVLVSMGFEHMLDDGPLGPGKFQLDVNVTTGIDNSCFTIGTQKIGEIGKPRGLDLLNSHSV